MGANERERTRSGEQGEHRMHKYLAGLTVCGLLGVSGAVWADELPKGPDEDGTKPALTRIAGEGMMNSHAFQYLTELSDDIGARVTGTPAERKAEEWGAAKMKAIGWTGSTVAGGAEGQVVTVNLFDIDDEIKNASRLKGKVVLVVQKGQPKKNFMMLFASFGDFLKVAHQAGAIAVIGGQGGSKSTGMNLTHTGILGFDADFAIPVVSMTAEDQVQLERFIAKGVTPRIRINVQNTLTSGPVETANVVGEIRGREHAEQILVVGGHLDSWDLAQGATDNGSGTATTLGAAEAIMRSGQKPRRTIRFVLFTGEEQGLDGSFAYIKQHAAELPNHLGDLILDEGQGAVTDFMLGGRDDLIPAFQPFVSSLGNVRPLQVNDKVESGTDTLPFSIAGLPGINMNQETSEYKFTHHSAADALDAQKPDVLTQNATLMALTAFWIADRPERLAAPWPAKGPPRC